MLMETRITGRKTVEEFEVELVSAPLVPDESMDGYMFRPTFARVTITTEGPAVVTAARIMGFRVNPSTRATVGHLRGMAPNVELERRVIDLTRLENFAVTA